MALVEGLFEKDEKRKKNRPNVQEKPVEVKKEETPVKAKEPKKETPAIPQLAKVTVDLANVRKEPSLTADIVKVATKNAEFRVASDKCTSDFTAINIQGDIGYIKTDLLVVFDNPAYAANTAAMQLGGK